ncbi:MAG: nitroreductase family protein [Geodermatophilaceae bacterium]
MDEEAVDLLHPLLASRWSPTTFDPSARVSPAEVESLLEAARWAPSAGTPNRGRSSSALAASRSTTAWYGIWQRARRCGRRPPGC